MYHLGDQRVDINGKTTYYSERYKTFLDFYGFCSEEFVCCTCLRDSNTLREGFTRYDSLVLCFKHNEGFKPVMQKLYSIFENNPNITVIKDLGLN